MIKESSPLLQIKLKKKKSFIYEIMKNVYESIYSLFDLILENPIENIWFEVFNIINGYIQLIIYLTDKTVSNNNHFYPIIVFTNNKK